MPRPTDPQKIVEILSIKERPSGNFEVRVTVDWNGVQSKPRTFNLLIKAFEMAVLWEAYEERRKRLEHEPE